MEKVSIPKESLERLLADALEDQKDWESKGVESMANWHEGRASMAKMLLDVYAE
jgi:hypothetical protein